MRLILYLLFILMPMQMMAKSTLATTDIVDEQHLLELLDEYIDRRELYTEQKEEKIKQLKLKLRIADSNTSRLSILNTIYHEYYTYRYDSAMVYANRGLSLALSDNNTYYATLNRINRAAVLSTGGFYSQAETLLNEIGENNVPHQLKQYYYYTTTWLYSYWEAFCDKSEFKDYYRQKKLQILRLTVNTTHSNYVGLYAYLSGELAYLENPLGKNVLRHYTIAINNSPVNSRVHASAAYCIARYYREIGNMQLYEKYIVEAAISDIVCPLKENLALQELSTYLYKKDTKYADRAARYIYCSMEDAKFYNNRLRMLEISSILPIIATANQEALAHKERIVRGVLAVVSFLSLVLFAMAIFGYKQNKWLVTSRREVKSQNRQLTELNEKLIATNHRRETYMRLFMDISAVYIRKIIEYRKLVSRKIKANQAADLLKTINSYKLAEEEATTFYTRFDRAFIELYPGFVDELNSLLLPESKIAQPSPNSLTTEVRIYALMRLGVTDSQEIATLLFYSTQTIYNYKSAMRARAINRDTFDDDINRLCHVGQVIQIFALIHFATSCSTSGEMVSSICWYSVTMPVLQCWNRWLTPSIFFIECLQLASPFSILVVLASQSTCVSLVPLRANTGHFISGNSLPTSTVRKWRMYGVSACCNALMVTGLRATGTSSMFISLAFLPLAISSSALLMLLQ